MIYWYGLSAAVLVSYSKQRVMCLYSCGFLWQSTRWISQLFRIRDKGPSQFVSPGAAWQQIRMHISASCVLKFRKKMSFFSQNHTEINSDDWTITKKTTRTTKHDLSKMKKLKDDRWALSLKRCFIGDVTSWSRASAKFCDIDPVLTEHSRVAGRPNS